jgi:hypothetical protein
MNSKSAGTGLLFFLLLHPCLSPIFAEESEDKVIIAAGTKFKVSLATPLSSKLTEVGDNVIVTLSEPLRIDAFHCLKRGTELNGTVTSNTRSGRVKGRAEMMVLIDKLVTDTGYKQVVVSIVTADDSVQDEKVKADEEGKLKANRDTGGDVDKALKGAGVGSIATVPVAIATGSPAAAIAGPAVGALVGILFTRGKEIRLPAGTILRMKFDKDFQMDSALIRCSSLPQLSQTP